MFNPHQRGGRGTLVGDIDKVAHTHCHTHTGQIGGQQEGGFERGLTTPEQDTGSILLS